jgi:hypothetical protein
MTLAVGAGVDVGAFVGVSEGAGLGVAGAGGGLQAAVNTSTITTLIQCSTNIDLGRITIAQHRERAARV